MCKTHILSFLLCKHTTSKTKPCTPLTGLLNTLGFFIRPCRSSSATSSSSSAAAAVAVASHDINDLCPPCRAFFTARNIPPRVYRDLAITFLRTHRSIDNDEDDDGGSRKRSITPTIGRHGEVEFRLDAALPLSRFTVAPGSGGGDERTRLEGLEAATWVLGDGEVPAPAGPQAQVSLSRSRRGSAGSTSSTSSTRTIWPSAAVDDDGKSRLGEQDEFGNSVGGIGEVSRAVLGRTRIAVVGRGLIDPNGFELVHLEGELAGSVDGKGFKGLATKRDMKPVAELPSARPQRNLTERPALSSYYSME
ncbi:hypothetical protein LZ554_001139 [Drepanopeziza brunnea f. sp. 'monogermtubi']|nr:hypothetical protein LZ554_001139 [Drepanopeziza brunnea f. sp. 'monogermtubi']